MTVNKHTDRIILLFDVDGVIVRPVAYRTGIRETIKKFCRLIGLRSTPPSEKTISAFEALGVHDVWDMTGICAAIILADLTVAAKGINFRGSISDRLRQIRDIDAKYHGPNYDTFLEKNREAIEQSSYPPETAGKILAENVRESVKNHELAGSFKETIAHFVSNTRDVYKNFTTQMFQSIILGSEEFKQFYKLKLAIESDSLLRTMDKVLINKESIELLRKATEKRKIKIAIYTGRPSLPPKETVQDPTGFSPEAEIALSMAGMDNYPLIGMGSMQWLGQQVNEPTEMLTKPDFTQALAAIAAAIDGNNCVGCLNCAYAFSRKKQLGFPLTELKKGTTRIYVFEDSPSGLKATNSAVSALNRQGMHIENICLGISSGDAVKREALNKLCAYTGNTVNECVKYVLNIEGVNQQ